MPVEVRATAVRRAWRANGSLDDLWVQVECDLGFEAFTDVVDAVNDVALRTSSVLGTMPAPMTKGHVVMLSGVTDAAPLDSWLDLLATELTRRGGHAVVKPVPDASVPTWVLRDAGFVPTLYLVLPSDPAAEAADPERKQHWHVPEAMTLEAADEVVRWALQDDGPVVLLRRNVHTTRLEARDAAAAAPLARALIQTGMAGYEVLSRRGPAGRHLSLGPRGEAVLQVYGDPRAASTLLAPLIALAPHATLGLIRTSAPYTLSLTGIASAYPLAGEVEEHGFRSHRHLLADHVPDAHGIQVLTERHLARAHDLSAWDITDLGAGRHLVAAADLAPWYDAAVPAPEVLAQARRDFGPMLLSSALR